MQGGAQQGGVPEFRVGEHGRDPEPGGADLPQQGKRLAPLLLKTYRRRNARAGARRRRQPRLRQIQLRAEKPGLGAGPQCGGHRDLTVPDLAERSAVLAGHPYRVRPLFRKARAVEDQHPLPIGDGPAHALPDLGHVPRRVGDEVLQGLITPRLAHAGEHRAHRLARAIAQNAEQIPTKGPALCDMAKGGLKWFEPPQQSIDPRRCIRRQHCAAAYRRATLSTMSSIQITAGILRPSDDLTK